MKIRTGFVSNSSSSSFVLMVKKDHFEKMISMMHPYVRALARAAGDEINVLGVDVMHFDGYDSDGESWLDEVYFTYNGEPFGDGQDDYSRKQEAWLAISKLFCVHWENRKDRNPSKVYYREQDY